VGVADQRACIAGGAAQIAVDTIQGQRTDTVALYQALGGGPWWSPSAQTAEPAAP
ncbi:histidine kinase, partial [Xanthomonas vasicola]